MTYRAGQAVEATGGDITDKTDIRRWNRFKKTWDMTKMALQYGL